MRVNHSFRMSCAILLAVFLAVATNALAYDISGTVTNSSGKSGRIYLNVQWAGGGSTGLGVSIPSPGPYTIRGVQNGDYRVQAFMDTQAPEAGIRHAADPAGYSASVTVNNANATGADLSLNIPAAIPPVQSPYKVQAVAGDRLAFVMWDPPRTESGAESAERYTVYWSTTPNPGPASFTGKSADLPSGRNSGYLVKGLTNGSSYYFAVTGRVAGGTAESAPANANNGQTLIVGPRTGGYTVSGTLDSTGIAKGSAPLWVAAAVPEKAPVAFSYIASPADLQQFSIAGIAPGNYQLYAILDMNNNGVIDAGDYMTGDKQAPSVTVGSADLPGVNFTLSSQATTASVGTSHWMDSKGDGYSLNFETRAVNKLPVNVAVSGPQLPGYLDMAADQEGGGSFRAWTGVANRPQASPTPDSYSFAVAYADGSSTGSTPLTAQVTGVMDSAAVPVSPIGSTTATAPLFTWSAPTTPPASPYYYSVSVDGNGSHWETRELPQSQLSVGYGADGGAPALIPGSTYSWRVNVSDARGNSVSGGSVTFTVSGSSPSTISFAGNVTDTAGAAVAGARVEVVGNSALSTTSGTDGYFSLSGIPSSSPFSVRIGKTGYLPVYTQQMALTTGITAGGAYTLYTSGEAAAAGIAAGKGAIKARVVDANQGSVFIAGAVVTATSQLHPERAYAVSYFDGTTWGGSATFANGSYLVLNVDEGDTVNVTAAKAGWSFNTRTFLTHADAVSEARIAGTVSSTTPTAAISGRVTNGAGVGIANVNVEVIDATTGSFRFAAATDRDGNYTVSQLASGSYKVHFSYLGGPTPQETWFDKAASMDAARPVQLTVPNNVTGINAAFAVSTLSGRVLDAGGLGVCGAHINAFSPTGSAYGTTAPDGSYTLTMPEGSYTVSFNYYPGEANCGGTSYPRYSAPGTTVTVSGSAVKDFSLPQLNTVSGKVVDGSGAGLAGVRLNFTTATSQTGTGSPSTNGALYGDTVSGSDGSYSIRLYGGTYGVNLSLNDLYSLAEKALAVTGNLTRDFTWRNPPVISGFSPDQGHFGSQVTITGSGFGASASGSFVSFSGLPASIVSWSESQIVAAVPSGAYSGSISVNVQGQTAWSSVGFNVLVDPPKVLRTLPAKDAAGMPVNGGVFASFDSQLDYSSINNETFTLKDNSGVSVPGSVQADGDSIGFVPAQPLGFGKSYTATLATGIRSSYGTALPAPYSWSFTTAQSLGNSFTLQGGLFSLDTFQDNVVPAYYYDVIEQAADGVHLTDSWFAWQSATGQWAAGPAKSDKDGYYGLTDSGWQLSTDDPTAGTIASNSDGSFTWTNTVDGSAQRMEPVEYQLAGAPLSAYADPADLPAPPTGSYPDGSKAYSFRQTTLNDTYRIHVWTTEPGMPDQNYLRYNDASGQRQTVRTLAQVPTLFATSQKVNYLYGSSGNLGMQLAQDGTVALFQSSPQSPPYQISQTGTWEYITVRGQQLLVIHLPDGYRSQDGEIFYAAMNEVVKQGERRAAGTMKVDAHPNYNQAAFYWMIGAPPPAPKPAAQTIVFDAPPAINFGGTGTVSARGGASGNPVIFSSTTPAVCTVNGSTVTPVAVGSCLVAANQAGNDLYLAAPQVTQEIMIAKGGQKIGVISFTPEVLKVGATATLGATGGPSGNPVTFVSASAAICRVNGGTVTGLSVGTCGVIASQAGNDNYHPAAPVTASVAVGSTVPGAPGAVQAKAGNAQVAVSFTAPVSGGSEITGYTVTSSPGGISVSGTASPILVTGLNNGTAYTFTVTARNVNGSGEASAASNPATPSAEVPGAPIMGLATAARASATVSFSAPATNGGSAITGYTVSSEPAGGVDSNAGSTGTIHTITGLTNGTSYSFTVTASNVSGTGAPSAASNRVTPVGVPGAPTAVAASAEHGMARVSFNAPGSDGGSAIIRYTVISTPGNFIASGPASPITVYGLADGVSYSFSVTATSAAGAGAPSAPSNVVTPSDTVAPVVRSFSVPNSISAPDTATSSSVPVLAFTASDDAAVTGYLVTTSPTKPAPDAAGWSTNVPASCQIASTPGEHTVYAFARDAAGNVSSPYSATVLVTPIDTTAPVILAGPIVTSLTNTTAVVEWQTNEAALGGIRYGNSTALGSSVNESGEYTTRHALTLSGLAPDSAYFLSVFASDRSGNGPTASKQISVRTKPAPDTTAPYLIEGPAVVAIGPDSATVQWRTNEPAQGEVFYGTANTLGQAAAEPGFVTFHSVRLSGLSAQTLYYLKVSASDLAGNGPRESGMAAFTTAALPDTTAPVIVEGPMVVNVSDTGATVLWKTNEPATSTVMSYDGANYALVSDKTLSYAHSVTLTGLRASSAYSYKVSSTDGSGNGMTMNSFRTFSTLAAPDHNAPVIIQGPLVVDVSYRSAAIRWQTDEPADGVIEYGTSESFGNSASQSALERTHNLTLTGLAAGTVYYFRVASTDAFGNGPSYSRTFSFVTGQDASYKVPVITVAPSVIYKTDTSMTVYWETDDPSDSVVDYGEGDQLSWRVADSEKVNRHQLTLTNLKKNTAYRVVVSSTNMSGNTVYAKAGATFRHLAYNLGAVYSDASPGSGSLGSITTAAQADTTAPVLTVAPSVAGITDTQATISWTTDEISDSQLSYGPQGGVLASSAGDPTQVTTHTVVLTNLAPSTQYQFQASSTDPSGNGPSLSAVLSFTTAATPDTTAPIFQGSPALVISYQDGTGKTSLGWNTDEPSTTQIKYGTSASALTSQAALPGISQGHALTLALQPGTTYYAVAVAIDGSGNAAESSPLQFTTMGSLDVTQPSTTATPAAGSYLGAQSVTLSADKPSIIYYTTDGSTPTTSAQQYNGPIALSSTSTVKYFAVDAAGNKETARSAAFVIQHAISASASDTNGSISCPSVVNAGESAVCTLTPNAGFRPASASGCGGALSGASFTTAAITADCSVTASFTPITVSVTPATAGSGNISPSTVQTVSYGSNTSFTLTPATGYQLDSVTGCGGTLSGTTYTTGAVSTACTVTATFTPVAAPAVAGDVNGDGSVDIVDAVQALRITVGLVTPGTAEAARGDVAPLSGGKPSGDGKIDITDVLTILRKSVGLIQW